MNVIFISATIWHMHIFISGKYVKMLKMLRIQNLSRTILWLQGTNVLVPREKINFFNFWNRDLLRDANYFQLKVFHAMSFCKACLQNPKFV